MAVERPEMSSQRTGSPRMTTSLRIWEAEAGSMLGGRWERTEVFFVAQMSSADGGDSGEEWGGERSGEEEGGAL